jgi:transcriptional regulator with XRE-family HTH domain
MSTIADDVTRRVGAAIKQRRVRLGLTLRALASRSGVSASMISDVERGEKSPTLSIASALAQALGVTTSALLEAAAPASGLIHVIRASEQTESVDPASGARRLSFGPAPRGSKIEFMRYAVPPKKVAGPFTAHPRGTIEHMHLAAGNIRAVFGTEEVLLRQGDSCTCLADISHRFDNAAGKREALIYIVVEHP